LVFFILVRWDLNEEKICFANFPKGKQSSGLFTGEGRTGESPILHTNK